MNEQTPNPRPTQVTVGAGMAAAGSALLVLTLFDSMSALGSMEVRHTIAGVLADSGSPGGVTVAAAVHWLHVLMLIAGGAAAASAVLAGYALFRHRGARIGLTVAAAVLLLTVVSGVLGLMVAIATAMLWTRPARDWFAGRAPAPDPGASTAAGVSSAHHPLLSSADEGRGGERPGEPVGQPGERPQEPEPGGGEERPAPPPTYGFGTPQAHQGPPAEPGPQGEQPYPGQSSPGQPYPGQPYPGQSYPGQSYPGQSYPGQSYPGQGGRPPHPGAGGPYPPPGGWPPPAYGQPRIRVGERPTTVTVAAVLTWLFSAIALVAFVIAIAFLVANRTDFINAVTTNPAFRGANVSESQIVAAAWVACAIVVFWCVVSMVLAFFAFRGHNWARITLVVSAAVSAGFALSAFPFSLAHIIVAIAVIVLLFTGGANDYFRRPPAYPQPPYGPPPGPPQHYGQQPPQDRQDPPPNVW